MAVSREQTRQGTPSRPALAAVPDRPTSTRATQQGGSWWLAALLAVGLLLLIMPFIWMVLGSLKTSAELLRLPPTWWPAAPTLENYVRLFARLDFPRYFFNSTVIALVVTLANLVFCSMLGYALAKLRFAGQRLLFGLVIATLLVPGSVTLVPLFVLISKLGLVNTYPAVILPFAAAPFGVFLMRQYLLDLPKELLDAGRVDGAGEYYLFWRIALPMAGPALAALGIMTFLGSWNGFLWPLIVLTDASMYTLPVALGVFAVGQHSADYGLLMAGAVVVVTPVLIVFLALQRYFTQGIAMTGIKG